MDKINFVMDTLESALNSCLTFNDLYRAKLLILAEKLLHRNHDDVFLRWQAKIIDTDFLQTVAQESATPHEYYGFIKDIKTHAHTYTLLTLPPSLYIQIRFIEFPSWIHFVWIEILFCLFCLLTLAHRRWRCFNFFSSCNIGCVCIQILLNVIKQMIPRQRLNCVIVNFFPSRLNKLFFSSLDVKINKTVFKLKICNVKMTLEN